MLTYLQDTDRLSIYVVCNFALSLSLFYLFLYVLLCDMLVAYGPLSLIYHHPGNTPILKYKSLACELLLPYCKVFLSSWLCCV